ncbi:MAG: peptidase [Gammaproteobacteria bacterium]|nr:peptidase [Gammaproteobacteria bacterium]
MQIRHKALRRFWQSDGQDVRGLDAAVLPRIRLMLTVLSEARGPEGLRGNPGWFLHPLKGDLAGFWSLRVTGNRRLIFRFDNQEAIDVDLVDYH